MSTEWSSKLQSLLETHGPILKLQPLTGPVKPSDNDPTNFGMINAPVSVTFTVQQQTFGDSINTGLDYWNGGLTFFNALYLVIPTSHVHTAHTIVWLMVLISDCGHLVHADAVNKGDNRGNTILPLKEDILSIAIILYQK